MFRKLVTSLAGLVFVATFLSVLAGPSLGSDAPTAHAGTAPETLQCVDLDIIKIQGLACIALDPQTDTNTIGDTHTITATISRVVNGTIVEPLPDLALYIFVIKGPNAGERVSAVTDMNGQVALTYTGDGGVGTDQFGTEACLLNDSCLSSDGYMDSCVADPDPCIDTFFNNSTCDGSPGDQYICDNATKDWEEAQAVPSPTPQSTADAATAVPTAMPTAVVPALPETGTSAGAEGGVSGQWLIAALAMTAAIVLAGAAWFTASRRQA